MPHLQLIPHFKKALQEDSVSLFYHGIFDDDFTDKFISILAFDSERKIKGRMAFVLAESFQNVIRHKDEELGSGNNNSFGIRGREEWFHIFSSNLVNEEAKEYLDYKLGNINAFDQDELKEVYMKILASGQLSNKGGAGLGLIEMARKSDNPIQFHFHQLGDDVFTFNMQVDFERSKEKAAQSVVPIEDNLALNQLILDDNIMFIYNGEFSDDVLKPMIPIVENNASVEGTTGYSVFHIAVELMQNIGRHGKANEDGVISGLFIIKKLEDGYYICSGNYTDADLDELRSNVADLNKRDLDDLNALYKEALKISLQTNVNSAKVGLIDIVRTAKNPVDLEVIEDDIGKYVMIGAKITV